ncbi:hypothetical protein EHQ46_15845 [Leptospira yanagawae]|uniref:Uncharacterized protein n=1 Tax=Leptospira yanagawae TaxID=293069 RepID=A0ABY2LXX6_9LEPT|nr:hypothetical protein [Leptospira yanagawae]TGL17927.1 hypothetical protein EHQ46_15845 [Leptospira yanagawae]
MLSSDVQSAVSFKEKPLKGKIALVELASKNLVSLNISATNITDNLHFALKEGGFEVIRIATAIAIDQVSANSGQNIELSSIPVTLSQNRKYVITEKEKIASICSQKGVKYVITGFIFEADIGTILDEDYSSGVILYIYDDTGELINMYKYIGYEKLLSFESNSMIANKLAKKITNSFK